MFGRLRYAIPFAGAILALSLHAPAQGADRIETGITAPSSSKELAFANQGIIARVEVKNGDVVKKGQLLMVQDEQLEAKRLEAAKQEADRSALIKAREATLENKKVVAERKKGLFAKQAISESEFQEAELDVKLAEAELELAKQEQLVKVAEMETQAIRLAQCRLLAPSDGIISDIKLTEGEVASIERPALAMVQNDPMYIDVKTLPPEIVKTLQPGQQLDVRYKDEQWAKAKINFIAPQADARAGSQAIRLEMPNPENRKTGLTIEVKIPSVVENAAK